MDDRRILERLGEGLSRRRLDRNQTQDALARAAGVSKRTVVRLEAGESVQLTSLLRVLRSLGRLEAVLETVAPAAEPSPLQALQVREQAPRRRASSTPKHTTPRDGGGWTWGDTEPNDGTSA